MRRLGVKSVNGFKDVGWEGTCEILVMGKEFRLESEFWPTSKGDIWRTYSRESKRLTLMSIKRNGLQQVANEFIETFHHDAKRYPFDSSGIWKERGRLKNNLR